MIFTQHYESPLGGILLAADDIGLTGLWFEGQKYFARTLDAVHQEQETAVLSEARPRRSIPLALPFSRRCGRCCAASPAARPRPMGHWQGSWLQSAAFPGCLRRLWAGLSVTM